MRKNFMQITTKTVMGTVASCALVGAIAPQPSQAAVFTYDSAFSLTANSGTLPTLFPTIATGSARFTKADSLTSPGLFDYQVENFQATLVPLNLNFTLDILRQPQNATLIGSLNTAVFTQLPTEFQKYSQIIPSVLAGTSPNYTGDGDFPPLGTFSYSFSNQDILNGVSLAVSQLPTLNLPAPDASQLSLLLNALPTLFPNGGTASITFSQVETAVAPSTEESGVADSTSTAAPEPTTIAGLALAGGAMIAARRRQKQKNTV